MGCHTSGNLMDVIGTLDEDFGIQLRILKTAKPKGKHPFDGIICDECGEMVVEEYGRIKGDKKVCIDCANGRKDKILF